MKFRLFSQICKILGHFASDHHEVFQKYSSPFIARVCDFLRHLSGSKVIYKYFTVFLLRTQYIDERLFFAYIDGFASIKIPGNGLPTGEL